jgi:hypothetical protein
MGFNAVKVTVKNGEGMRHLMSVLNTLEQSEIQVGWFNTKSSIRSDDREDTGAYDAYKAVANEFGKPSSKGRDRPPRPFIFQNMDKVADEVISSLQENRELKASNVRNAFQKAAEQGANQIRENIDSVFNPQLSGLTIRLRGNGSTKPLVDTGSMRKNVKGKVVRKK